MRPLALLTLAAALAGPARAVDTIVPTTGAPLEGLFMGYENGAFQILNKEQKTVRQLVASTRELRLDPPREVTVAPRAGKPETLELRRFEKGQFYFARGGAETPRPLSLVKRIEVPFSAQGNVDDLSAQVLSRGAEIDLASLADTGRTTIVHFHYPKSVASVRQGALVATLARDSRGTVTLRKVEVPDWEAPVARQLQVKSLPQFWFYDARGNLSGKLTERFTDEDIASALRNAQR